MPNTAKYVAKLQGDKNWRGDLTNAATNINFGSFYLRHVMDKFDDHQVLATASYNAGPHRIDKWLEDESLDADVWIDTIPFTETRRYVRAVLAYAAIYEYHLTGKPSRLSSKLRTIPASPEA
jgi:soluble lytic murein transglycosylase